MCVCVRERERERERLLRCYVISYSYNGEVVESFQVSLATYIIADTALKVSLHDCIYCT